MPKPWNSWLNYIKRVYWYHYHWFYLTTQKNEKKNSEENDETFEKLSQKENKKTGHISSSKHWINNNTWQHCRKKALNKGKKSSTDNIKKPITTTRRWKSRRH